MEHPVDASTCKSFLLRRGLGGIKHLDTKAVVGPRSYHGEGDPSIEDHPRGESRRHFGVALKRQGDAQARQEDGL